MNPEEVKQIVETIKTLNINFNDATTQKVAEAIVPVVKLYFIKELLLGLVIGLAWVGVFALLTILTYKVFMGMVEADKEKKFKEEERLIMR